MNIRILTLTYMAAFLAGTFFKTVQYFLQPDEVGDFNTVVMELTIVSALVAFGVSLFYMFKAKKNNQDEES